MENNETKKPRSKSLPVILGLVILTGAFFGIKKYSYSLHHEVTDDAQIEGDIFPVISRASGYVNKISFEENQLVQKGDTVILLDDRDLEIKVQQAEAALENATATAAVSKANISSASASLETEKSTIETARIRVWKSTNDYNRYKELLRDSAVTVQQFETVQAEKESAEALLKSELGKQNSFAIAITSAERQMAVATATIAQKRADVEYAKLQLSYATVLAPASGFASKKNVQPGQLVNAGSPMFALVQDNDVYVIANFKETQLKKMSIGEEVEITVDAYPDTVFKGSVYKFSSATGAKFSMLPPDNATGNFVKVVQRLPVKISIISGKEVREKLRPGMSVKVAVKVD